MPSYRPNVDRTTVPNHSSGTLKPESGETKVTCPKCGSPYLASVGADEPRYGAALPNFSCTAGDCGYLGSARRA